METARAEGTRTRAHKGGSTRTGSTSRVNALRTLRDAFTATGNEEALYSAAASFCNKRRTSD